MLQNVITGEKGTVASFELTILQMVGVPRAKCVNTAIAMGNLIVTILTMN